MDKNSAGERPGVPISVPSLWGPVLKLAYDYDVTVLPQFFRPLTLGASIEMSW